MKPEDLYQYEKDYPVHNYLLYPSDPTDSPSETKGFTLEELGCLSAILMMGLLLLIPILLFFLLR